MSSSLGTEIAPAIVLNFLLCVFTMAAVWFWQKRSENAGWVDVAWAGLLGVQAAIYIVMGDGDRLTALLTVGLAIIWSLRLTIYLFHRVSHEAEDGRYQALRLHWGAQVQRKMFWFFHSQAWIAWSLGLVFYVLAEYAGPVNGWAALGLALGILAIGGETLADRQLANHRSKCPGITCRTGLWRFSRHPNYFFEWLHWCAYPLMAMGLPLGIYTWLAPIIMLVFLYRVTGIPYTEKQALKSRGDDYREYQRTTSAFFPWFSRGRSS